MRMIPQATTHDCKRYFKTTNYSRESHGSLLQRGNNANDGTSITDVSHEKKAVPERKHIFLADVIFLILILTTYRSELESG